MTLAARSYRVAAIQFEPMLFEKASNLRRLLALTNEAVENGARLIVHPEMANVGYCWQSRDEIAPHVEPIPGPTTELFADVAARSKTYIVTGLAEVAPDTGIFYNSAVLIGPDGAVGVYRKTHSYISEPKWAKDGDLGIPVFETELGRIAMIICMDATFFEPARIAALQGADVICFPTNWLSEKSPSPVWMARAYENDAYLIPANRYGLERGVQFSGGSCVIDPDGAVQDVVDTGDGIVYGQIDLTRIQADRLAGRRPECYGNLTLNSYLWHPSEFHDLYDLRPLPKGRTSMIAVAQMSPVVPGVELNLDRIEATADANPEADLIVFPELTLSGLVRDRIGDEQIAETIPGKATKRLTQIAAANGTYLVVGLIERADETLYNSAVLVGPEGVVGTYRKLHLSPTDQVWSAPGDLGLPTFDTHIGRIGLQIGHDVNFPEAARCLALDGADLIAWPSSCGEPPVRGWGSTSVPHLPHVQTGPTDCHFHLWRERSKENCTYVAFANDPTTGMGWSGIFAPTVEGEPVSESLLPGPAEGVIILKMDTTNLDCRYVTNYARAKDLLGMRAPIWYDPLQVRASTTASRCVTVANH
ncbi:MAG: nitrilase-related carbon-nitrogen hydrolase [Thermomicrobiales bacterium]